LRLGIISPISGEYLSITAPEGLTFRFPHFCLQPLHKGIEISSYFFVKLVIYLELCILFIPQDIFVGRFYHKYYENKGRKRNLLSFINTFV